MRSYRIEITFPGDCWTYYYDENRDGFLTLDRSEATTFPDLASLNLATYVLQKNLTRPHSIGCSIV